MAGLALAVMSNCLTLMGELAVEDALADAPNNVKVSASASRDWENFHKLTWSGFSST